jgi:hypothetical protein
VLLQVTTPDGCRCCVLLPAEFSKLPPSAGKDSGATVCIPMPFTEIFVNGPLTNLKVYLSKAITAVVNIEPFLLVPIFLGMLGLDSYASLTAVTMLVLASISQIPKRFSFRARPYMVSRARGFTKDPTTSFPSVSERFPLIPSQYWLFTPELQ